MHTDVPSSAPTLAAVPSAPPAPPASPGADAAPDPAEESLPRRLRVEPWADPVVDHLGHDPRSAYVEQFWLPILGPLSMGAEPEHELWISPRPPATTCGHPTR